MLLVSRAVADLTGCTGVWQLSLVTIAFTFLSFCSWSLIWVCKQRGTSCKHTL